MKYLTLLLLTSTLLASTPKDANLPIDKECIFGLLHDICYWHLDDHSFFEYDKDSVIELYFKQIDYKHDKSDFSEYYEMVVPDLDLIATLKKANYSIPEMDYSVSNQLFKIVVVHRIKDIEKTIQTNKYTRLEFQEKQIMDYIFSKQNKFDKTTPEIVKRLTKVLPTISKEIEASKAPNHIFYVAPISKYSNKIVIFVADIEQLIVISGDSDISQDLFWKQVNANTKVYDLEGDVVTSLLQTEGSNAYITKNWVGRILYNCIIDGTKIVI